jgi:hypothetical protein
LLNFVRCAGNTEYRLAYFQSQPAKSHQPDLGHVTFAKAPEQHQLNSVSATVRTGVPRISTEPNTL